MPLERRRELFDHPDWISRIILDRMTEHGASTHRLIDDGGMPQTNPVLDQIYANVLDRPVLVPNNKDNWLEFRDFCFLAARGFASIEEAQEKLCPSYIEYAPEAHARKVYDELYGLYRSLYFGFGKRSVDGSYLGAVLPALIQIAHKTRINWTGLRNAPGR